LADLLRTLAARGLGSVLVEGGSRILHAFLFHQLVDWVVVTIAPRFSAGKPALDGDGSQRLPSLASIGTAASGSDILVWGKPTWRPA
jgi:3,4-dihydroxy 2-butanone 4-phosphate synthase/GTP cyclohydrolase II